MKCNGASLWEMKPTPTKNANPPQDEILVGLDIGSTKISVAVGAVNSDGVLSLMGIGTTPSRGIRNGLIIDFEAASKCIHKALVDAEVKTDVMIKNVNLALTGAHISSFNTQGRLTVSTPETKCKGNDFLLYQQTVDCLKTLDVEVESVIFSPYAAAQAVLNSIQKKSGAIVIDWGGGTLDYVVYLDCLVIQSGMLPVRYRGQRPIHRVQIHEMLIELKRLITSEYDLKSLEAGVFITGGVSLFEGIGQIVEDVFQIPVHLTHEQTVETSTTRNPQFSTAIGLLFHISNKINNS